jgi:FixJ family two-component response regulator
MLTGFGDIMQEKSEMPVGVTNIVSKPVTRNALRHAMRRAMCDAGETQSANRKCEEA